MLGEYHLWSRLTHIAYWWMHVMIGVWLAFALLLFLIEPLRSRLGIERRLAANQQAALVHALRLHRIVLLLSLIAIFVSVCGAHGLL